VPIQTMTLARAITVEAARLALVRVQSEPVSNVVDGRRWCRRHLVGCSALVGLGAGFLAGAAWAPEDFGTMPSALVLGAYGAGIGAATGGIIGVYTRPRARANLPP
jgi:hypothetical protein